MTFYYIYTANGDIIKKKPNNFIECFETIINLDKKIIRTDRDIINNINNENTKLKKLRSDQAELQVKINKYKADNKTTKGSEDDEKEMGRIINEIDESTSSKNALTREINRNGRITSLIYINDTEKLNFINKYNNAIKFFEENNKAITNIIDINNEIKSFKNNYETAFNNTQKAIIASINAVNAIKTNIDEESANKIITDAENLKTVSATIINDMLNKITAIKIKIKEKQDSDAQAVKDAIALKEINNAIEIRNKIRKEDIVKLKKNENDEKLTLKDAYNKAITDGLNLVDSTDTLKSIQTQYESAFDNFSKTTNNAENAVNLIKTANYKNDIEIDKINKDEKTADNIINNAKKLKLEKDTLKKSLQDAITNFTAQYKKFLEQKKDYAKYYIEIQGEINKKLIDYNNEKLTILDTYNKAITDGIDPTNKLKSLYNDYEKALDKSTKENIDILNSINSIKINDNDNEKKMIDNRTMIDNIYKLKIEKELEKNKVKEILLNNIKELNQLLLNKRNDEINKRKEEILQNNLIHQEARFIQRMEDYNEKQTLRDAYYNAIADGIDPTNNLILLQNQYETAFDAAFNANINALNAIKNAIKSITVYNESIINIINDADKLKLEKEKLKKKLLDNITELRKKHD